MPIAVQRKLIQILKSEVEGSQTVLNRDLSSCLEKYN